MPRRRGAFNWPESCPEALSLPKTCPGALNSPKFHHSHVLSPKLHPEALDLTCYCLAAFRLSSQKQAILRNVRKDRHWLFRNASLLMRPKIAALGCLQVHLYSPERFWDMRAMSAIFEMRTCRMGLHIRYSLAEITLSVLQCPRLLHDAETLHRYWACTLVSKSEPITDSLKDWFITDQ